MKGGVSMLTVGNLGYIFETKIDEKNISGIKESYSFTDDIETNIRRIDALFSVDVDGNILNPSYYDRALGFVPMTLDMDMEKFIRSNRAVYSLLPSTYLIVKVNAKVSLSTREWVDTSIDLYVPKGRIDLSKVSDKAGVGITCDKASSTGKLNVFQVSDGVLAYYKQLILGQLSNIVFGDKLLYLKGRVRT